MARVELRPSGQFTYAVVVDDVMEGGAWRKRVIRSFGNASDPNNVAQAHAMANALNAGQALIQARPSSSDEELIQALGLFVGVAIAALAVAWLLGRR